MIRNSNVFLNWRVKTFYCFIGALFLQKISNSEVEPFLQVNDFLRYQNHIVVLDCWLCFDAGFFGYNLTGETKAFVWTGSFLLITNLIISINFTFILSYYFITTLIRNLYLFRIALV